MGNYRIPGEPLVPPWVSPLLRYTLMHPWDVFCGWEGLAPWSGAAGGVCAPCCVLPLGPCDHLAGIVLLSPGLPQLLCTS